MVSLPSRQPDSIKNAEIDRLLYQVKVIKLDAEGLTAGLTREQWNWRPAPGRWSVAQCLAHLNTFNRTWVSYIDQAVSRGHEKQILRDGPYAYGFLSRLMLRTIEPPVKRRFKAPKSFEPPHELAGDGLLEEFIALHERVAQAIKLADGLDLVRIKVRSPVTRYLRYSLGMAFWFLTAHDRRHLWQARQVEQDPKFPRAANEAPSFSTPQPQIKS
jgi:hypothetical protein